MKKTWFVLLIFILGLQLMGNEDIRLNQLGYYPNAVKRFVVVNSTANAFQVRDPEGKTVSEGKLMDRGFWNTSHEYIKTGDFSSFQKPGKYRVFVEDKGKSYSFEIKDHLYREALNASLKSFYYQRASMELTERYAGQWKRPMGHPDNRCFYHPTSGRSQGYMNSPGGWYDAGDYNKYIVNAGVTVCTLLALYELYPEAVKDNAINIPTSGNGISDLLDEVRYELDWVLTMQDTDGGVFLKITCKKFPGMIMPHQETAPRYVVGKTTAATLNFSAMTAQAARVFKKIDNTIASRCLTAAQKAWQWAVKNPELFFRNPADIETGEYYDADLKEEFFWAAAELLITTGNDFYRPYVEKHIDRIKNEKKASWRCFVDELGCFSLASVGNSVPVSLKKRAVNVILRLADGVLKEIHTIPYRIPWRRYEWGSNGEMANDALILAYAYTHSGKHRFLEGVIETVDYLFGKNAVGYSFLTGFGKKSPQNIHQRPSAADGIDAPIPGFLVGGPNWERQDSIEKKKYYGVKYPFKEPAKSYLDLTGSFASNEVCINWNAPLVFVLAFLELNHEDMKRRR